MLELATLRYLNLDMLMDRPGLQQILHMAAFKLKLSDNKFSDSDGMACMINRQFRITKSLISCKRQTFDSWHGARHALISRESRCYHFFPSQTLKLSIAMGWSPFWNGILIPRKLCSHNSVNTVERLRECHQLKTISIQWVAVIDNILASFPRC